MSFVPREMENISIVLEVPPSGILSPSLQRRRCKTSQLQDYRVQEWRLPSPPSFKCNVLRESLSVDSQNIPCATLERRGSWGSLNISVRTPIYRYVERDRKIHDIFWNKRQSPMHKEKQRKNNPRISFLDLLAQGFRGNWVPVLESHSLGLFLSIHCWWKVIRLRADFD